MGTHIPFEQLHNVRDLGGIGTQDGRVVATGKLYRADQLFPASPADQDALAQLNLGLVVDFRSADERSERPDPELPGVRNLHIPVIKDVRAGIVRGSKGDSTIAQMVRQGESVTNDMVDEHMCNMYRAFVSDPYSAQQYGVFVDEVLRCGQAGKAALWHCTAGKDRAGFATVIVLHALGAPTDDIMADYLQTNDCLRTVNKHIAAMLAKGFDSPTAQETALRFLSANESYLAAAFEQATESFGSFDDFVETAVGITPDKTRLLQELYLQG